MKGIRAVVTGGAGFFGSHIVEALRRAGADVSVPRRAVCDLTTLDGALRAFEGAPDLVVHAAAYNGGLGLHVREQAKIYYENLLIYAHALEGMRRQGVKKAVIIGSACAYPGDLEGGMKEEDLWKGWPHGSVLGFGLVKRLQDIAVRVYRKDYDLRAVHLLLTNLYGPRDVFDPGRSHVVGALIERFVEARRTGAREVAVWGTGKALRDLLYVEDAAEAVLLAADKYDDVEPVNVSTGKPVSIRDLAETIRRAAGFEGEIRWDSSKPDGQMVKFLDPSRARARFGWESRTSLEEGIAKTVRWYEENR